MRRLSSDDMELRRRQEHHQLLKLRGKRKRLEDQLSDFRAHAQEVIYELEEELRQTQEQIQMFEHAERSRGYQ